nr:MAG TPA: hypothetical protein [Caudoviricetes sp.]
MLLAVGFQRVGTLNQLNGEFIHQLRPQSVFLLRCLRARGQQRAARISRTLSTTGEKGRAFLALLARCSICVCRFCRCVGSRIRFGLRVGLYDLRCSTSTHSDPLLARNVPAMLSQNGLTRNWLAFTLVVRHVAQRRGRLRRGGFFDELEEFDIVGKLLVSHVGEGQLFKAGDNGRALLVDGTQQSIALIECCIVQQTGNALLDNALVCALALSVKRLDLSRGKAVLCFRLLLSAGFRLLPWYFDGFLWSAHCVGSCDD